MFNLFKAMGSFWTTFLGKDQVKGLPETSTVEVASCDEFTAGAIFTLNLLQRDGRLIDFLQEDISGFSDAQVGAAVRQIHTNSAATVDKYFKLLPISEVAEGVEMELTGTLDPLMMRLTGNVDPTPTKGLVRHKGWYSSEQHLPQQVGERNMTVVCPAEINCQA